MTAYRAIVEIRKVFGQNLKKSKSHVFFSAKKSFTKNLFAGQIEGSFDKPGKMFSSGSPKSFGSESGNLESL